MARKPHETAVTLPVLDRLIDLEPGNHTEAPPSRSQSERMLQRAVRRDLEWLLNTRKICVLPDESAKELNTSVYTYGLSDLSALTMATASDRNKLINQITAAIKIFEPRLSSVQVVLSENAGAARNEVRLQIDAMLRMDPAPVPIVFDTVIELQSGNCRLSGAADAR